MTEMGQSRRINSVRDGSDLAGAVSIPQLPCDIDLSWLNPTPHAIAVYASRTLSPVATQHSLPSGRYSLLGPDFHRLDRTSLRLAHSLDHLVGAREQHRGTSRPSAWAAFKLITNSYLVRRRH